MPQVRYLPRLRADRNNNGTLGAGALILAGASYRLLPTASRAVNAQKLLKELAVARRFHVRNLGSELLILRTGKRRQEIDQDR